MADDIVTRLRHKQRLQEPWDMHKEPIFGEAADAIERAHAEVDLKGYRLDDALDEIERLRALINNVAQAIEDQGMSPDYRETVAHWHRIEWPTLWRAIDALLEARRVAS